MTDRPVTAVPGGPAEVPLIPAQLEPDAIGVTQDTIIGVSNSAPGATVGLVLAGLAAATAYGSAQTIVLCGTAMLVIANSLPAAEPVERQLRRLVRVGRPGRQPLLGVPHRLADDRR